MPPLNVSLRDLDSNMDLKEMQRVFPKMVGKTTRDITIKIPGLADVEVKKGTYVYDSIDDLIVLLPDNKFISLIDRR